MSPTMRILVSGVIGIGLSGCKVAHASAGKGSENDPFEWLKTKKASKKSDQDSILSPDFMSSDDFSFEGLSKKAHQLIETGSLGKIGYGFMMGYASGYCVKKISRVVAFAVGGIFMTVQILAYNGFLMVNYDKLNLKLNEYLDFNKDGSVDEKDAQVAYKKFQHVMNYNLPTGGGFSLGFLKGLRTI